MDHGALAALILTPAATLLEVGRAAFSKARSSSSFTALLTDTSEAVQPILDELAKSYRVKRISGSGASGRIRLFFEENLYRVIGLSTTFQANGVLFNVRNIETLQLSDDIPSTLPHYQNLKEAQDGSGLYYADITVYARTTGAVGNLVRGTELTMFQSALPYFVRAIAMETFTGGENDEDNDSLVHRMVLGISAKVLSSRLNMRAALLEKFPKIRDSSVIGAGDLEMTRDKHTIFPSSTGGYADWYIGTTRQLASTSHLFDSLILQETREDGIFVYSVAIDDSQISCLYRATEVQDEESLEYCQILSQSRYTKNVNESEARNAPLIHDDLEGAFTAYQITEIRFHSSKALSQVRVYGLHMPEIREIQEWVLQCSQAPIGLDILVKGAIPTLIHFSAVVHTISGISADSLGLQSTVADYINHLPMGGLLTVSGLIALLHRNLPSGCYVTRPALFGTTYLPDGRAMISETSDRLEINFPPFASNRTTLFFCDPADISFEFRFTERTEMC